MSVELRPWNVKPGDILVIPRAALFPWEHSRYVVLSVSPDRNYFSGERMWTVTGYGEGTDVTQGRRLGSYYRDQRLTIERTGSNA